MLFLSATRVKIEFPFFGHIEIVLREKMTGYAISYARDDN